jgi:hypothetical protein
MFKLIAPPQLIRRDFKHLKSLERLDTTQTIESLIFMQSIEGRAHNGAGAFNKRFYVNTTIDDIVCALGENPKEIKKARQKLIDEIFDFAKEVIEGKTPTKLINKKGRPFLRISEFKKRIVNPKDILRGLYLGGLRDNSEIRSKAEEIYHIKIGYGKCFPVDMNVMQKMGLSGEVLAHQEHEQKIEWYKEKRLIVPESKTYTPQIRYFYIRYKEGPGQSDDAAIIASGFLYNVDVALGVFLADAIDTLEKYVLVFRDQDDEIAKFIEENFKSLNLQLEDVYRLAYLSAIPEDREEDIPDSSLRYLLTLDPHTKISTLKNHLNFIEGKFYFPMIISYGRIMCLEFYRYMEQKIQEVKKELKPPIPILSKLGVEKKAKDLLGKEAFITVKSDTSVSEILKLVLKKKIGFVIVQDKNKDVVGIIDTTTLIPLSKRVS